MISTIETFLGQVQILPCRTDVEFGRDADTNPGLVIAPLGIDRSIARADTMGARARYAR